MDHLSKFVEVAAVPSLAAGFVIKFLQDRFEWKHGLPKKIISDRATTYRSRELRSYLRNAGVDHQFTSAYHPQANGLTERYNQTLLARLIPYCNNKKPNEADWDEHLQAAAYAINTAFQVSIGTSPYEVVYGQIPKLTAVKNLSTPLKVGRTASRQTACRVIRARARKTAANAQEAQKRYYDRRHRPGPQYKVGDEVWVQRCAQSPGKKLYPKYEGPFVITERLGENTWRVGYPAGETSADKRRKNNFSVHVSRLKKRELRQN